MRRLILILCASLFSVQAMAISARKIAQGRKWAQNEKRTEDIMDLVKRLKFEPSTPEPNYFQKIRIELNKAAMQEHEAAKARGVLKSSLLKLPVDTLGFFIATGAINYMTMWEKAGANPLLFQEQVLALKDPISHFSFYSFMAASGFYTDFATSGLSNEAKAIAMRRISFQALAAGSLASSVIADVGNSIKMCVQSWQKHYENASIMDAYAHKDDLEKSDELCNKANEIWTAKNASQKYIPQIFSMLLIQGATELAQSTATGLVTTSASALFKGLVAAGEKAGFQMLFVNVALAASPSGLTIRLISIVGKIMQFTLFVGVDHLLNNTLTRGFNNVFRPALFKLTDEYNINAHFEAGGKYGWDVDKISKLRPDNLEPNARFDKKSAIGLFSFEKYETSFPDQIRAFTKQLQGWRDHLNSDAEADLQGWMTMTQRMLNQMQVSENFYKDYVQNLFATSHVAYRTGLPADNERHLDKEAFNNIPIYPYRALPLFGVTFIPWKNSNVKAENAYMSYPSETEQGQTELLKFVASDILQKKLIPTFHLASNDRALAEKTIQAMMVGKPIEQGLALKEFMDAYDLSYRTNNVELRAFGKYLTSRIGNPKPMFNQGEGFAAAFGIENKSQIEAADFDTVDSTLKVNFMGSTEVEQYLMHLMVCGADTGSIAEKKVLFGLFGWDPDFLAPSIVTQKPKDYCGQDGFGNSSENFYTKAFSNPVSGKNYKNITMYITQNIRPDVLGDFRDKTKIADFKAWWSAHGLKNIPAVLKKWDEQFSHIVKTVEGNMFEYKKDSYTNIIDNVTQFNFFNDNILGSSLSESLLFEKEFYLQTINLVRTKVNFNLPAMGDVNILSEAKKIAIKKRSSVLKPLTAPEYVNISNAIDAMLIEANKSVELIDYTKQAELEVDLKTRFIPTVENAKKLPETYDQMAYDAARVRQLNYKRYLGLATKLEAALDELQASVGLKMKLEDVFDDDQAKTKSTVYEDAKLDHLNLEQGTVKAAVEGLKNIEDSISKFVRMKLLMRQGLNFSKKELEAFQKYELLKAASANKSRGAVK